jgi:Domain of unknown function (DUF4129)
LTREICCVLLGCALGLLTANPAKAQKANSSAGAQLSLRDYEAQLDTYSTSISASRRQPPKLARLRQSVPAQWQVTADGTNFTVSTAWLKTSLTELERNQKEADSRARLITLQLAALRAAAIELQETSALREPDVRDHLDNIFKRKEFARLRGPTDLQRLEARISRWIAEQLLRLLAHVHIGRRTGNIFSWTVIAATFVLLNYWVFRRLAGLAREAEPQTAIRQISDAASRQWLQEALAAADRADFREAIHCAYWAAVTRLEGSGVLTRDRARTPRESLRQLDAHPNERGALGELTRHLELIWYGYRPASAADWNGARTQLEHMGCLKGLIAPIANS